MLTVRAQCLEFHFLLCFPHSFVYSESLHHPSLIVSPNWDTNADFTFLCGESDEDLYVETLRVPQKVWSSDVFIKMSPWKQWGSDEELTQPTSAALFSLSQKWLPSSAAILREGCSRASGRMAADADPTPSSFLGLCTVSQAVLGAIFVLTTHVHGPSQSVIVLLLFSCYKKLQQKQWNNTSILSYSSVGTNPKVKGHQSCVPFWRLTGRESLPLPCPASRGCWHSLVLMPFHPQSQRSLSHISCFQHGLFWCPLFLKILKGSWRTLVITLVHLDNSGYSSSVKVSWLAILLPSATLIPPCPVPYSQLPGLRI